jgi:hypothetical protein
MGRGCTGLVTLEIDPKTGDQVAVKSIRFFAEIEVLAALNHPCILRITSWRPQTESAPAEIRTEFAANRSLKDAIDKLCPISLISFVRHS